MPPTLTEARWLRFLSFGMLYFAQGVPWGFITTGYVVLLADLGLDATAIGTAIGLAYLPWSFKILWGPLLDAVPSWKAGRRRPFIIIAEVLMGLSLLGLVFVDPKSSLPLVAAILFAHNTFAAMQDVAVDALAIDVLELEERGRANAFMWAGKSAGIAFGGGAGTIIAKHVGWNGLFLLMVAILWLIMLIPLFVRERKPEPTDVPVTWAHVVRLGSFLVPFVPVGLAIYALGELEGRYTEEPWAIVFTLAQPVAAVLGALFGMRLVDRTGFQRLRESFSFATPWMGVVFGVLTPIGYALVSTAQTRYLRADLHLTEEQIGLLSGVAEPVSGVVGALLGGVLADRLGARKACGLAMAAIAVVLGSWAALPSAWPDFNFVLGWSIVAAATISAYNATTLGLYMTLSNPKTAATQFAVFMAATNFTYAWTSPAGGRIADVWGMVTLFVVAAVIQAVTIGLLPLIDPRRAEDAYRVAPGT